MQSFDVVDLDAELLCCRPEQAVKETVELPMIWDAVTLMWHRDESAPINWTLICPVYEKNKWGLLPEAAIYDMDNWISSYIPQHIARLVQERRNSSALAMELRLSCTNPSICEVYLLIYAIDT